MATSRCVTSRDGPSDVIVECGSDDDSKIVFTERINSIPEFLLFDDISER